MNRTILALVLAALLIPAIGGAVEPPIGEVIYLVDSLDDQSGTSQLFRVHLNPLPDPVETLLEPLPNGLINFEQVDAIAATPDGRRIYLFNKQVDGSPRCDGRFGYYDVAEAMFHEVGGLVHAGTGDCVNEVVLAAFAPDGTLYVASQTTDLLYRVDPDTGQAWEVGPFRCENGDVIDLNGADFAFDYQGNMYLWSNGAPQPGLYFFEHGSLTAAWCRQEAGVFFTGLAMRANGYGEPVGSATSPVDRIRLIDSGDDCPMLLDGVPYEYTYGDMTNGFLGGYCTATIGYWKNHDWPVGVTVCGVGVDEIYGKEILSGATAKNMSMLVAQMIGAKLNTGNGGSMELIMNAEQWLCEQGVVVGAGDVLDWDMGFLSKSQKSTANSYKDALDVFNNSNHCSW